MIATVGGVSPGSAARDQAPPISVYCHQKMFGGVIVAKVSVIAEVSQPVGTISKVMSPALVWKLKLHCNGYTETTGEAATTMGPPIADPSINTVTLVTLSTCITPVDVFMSPSN